MNAQKLHQSVTIYVPAQLAGNEEVGALTRKLTEITGGCTLERANGVWIDDKGETHMDDILKMTWWHTDSDKMQVYMASSEIVLSLLKHGEKAVFAERMDDKGSRLAAIHSAEAGELEHAPEEADA